MGRTDQFLLCVFFSFFLPLHRSVIVMGQNLSIYLFFCGDGRDSESKSTPVSPSSQSHAQTISIIQRRRSLGIPGVINEGPVPVGPRFNVVTEAGLISNLESNWRTENRHSCTVHLLGFSVCTQYFQ